MRRRIYLVSFNFYKRLELVCQYIPAGKVVTYGQLALLCGKPNNSRQVGYALRANKSEEPIPAYRIINGSGILSGAPCFATPTMQKELLQKDGIVVDANNRVDLKEFQWHHTLDDALELHDIFKQLGI